MHSGQSFLRWLTGAAGRGGNFFLGAFDVFPFLYNKHVTYYFAREGWGMLTTLTAPIHPTPPNRGHLPSAQDDALNQCFPKRVVLKGLQ